MTAISPQWDAYANWLALDEAQRERLNLPKNKAEYAIANKLSDRTSRRWQNDPLFKALLDKKLAAKGKKGIQAVSVDGTPAVLEEDLEEASTQDSPDDEYQQIKSALVKGAMTGDPKYLDLYFKTYGKEFVAEEVAARTSDLAGLDLSELVVEAASAVGELLLVDYLRSQGYEVSRPSNEESNPAPRRVTGEEENDGQ
jgi:hypothetical protein